MTICRDPRSSAPRARRPVSSIRQKLWLLPDLRASASEFAPLLHRPRHDLSNHRSRRAGRDLAADRRLAGRGWARGSRAGLRGRLGADRPGSGWPSRRMSRRSVSCAAQAAGVGLAETLPYLAMRGSVRESVLQTRRVTRAPVCRDAGFQGTPVRTGPTPGTRPIQWYPFSSNRGQRKMKQRPIESNRPAGPPGWPARSDRAGLDPDDARRRARRHQSRGRGRQAQHPGHLGRRHRHLEHQRTTTAA